MHTEWGHSKGVSRFSSLRPPPSLIRLYESTVALQPWTF